MIIQIPEHFSQSPNILTLPTLSFLYYFNRDEIAKVNVELNQHMLIHVFKGSKIIHNKEIDYTVSSKQSAFVSKGQYFISEILSLEESCFEGMLVFFDDAFLLNLFNKYPSLSKNIEDIKIHKTPLCIVEKSEALHNTMLSTSAYLQRQSDEYLLIQLKFEEIFLQLLQSNSSNEILQYFQALYSKSLFQFKDFFENTQFETVEDMISQSKLSPLQFRKIFYELYQTTPKEWLLKNALQKAKKLLQNKQLNVSQVCFECGFNSISWFIKSFKKEFGITPKKFQQL